MRSNQVRDLRLSGPASTLDQLSCFRGPCYEVRIYALRRMGFSGPAEAYLGVYDSGLIIYGPPCARLDSRASRKAGRCS